MKIKFYSKHLESAAMFAFFAEETVLGLPVVRGLKLIPETEVEEKGNVFSVTLTITARYNLLVDDASPTTYEMVANDLRKKFDFDVEVLC